MEAYTNLGAIVTPLLAWYEQNRRPLPWREHPTPYHVWLSEIMLQQTRIEAVIPYYHRFLQAFPTVRSLAEADDERLMKLWEGLGYYSRARNLKRAAQHIVAQGGELPASYTALCALPGIGAYTAGAIASIAFGLPEPAVDGNVLRVIARLTADNSDVTKQQTKARVTAALREIYPQRGQAASAMTQALMELGEVVCLPNGAPQCDACPLGLFCQARQQGRVQELPVRAPKKARRVQDRTVFLLLCDGKIALRKRPDTGLLQGLWEFPGEEQTLTPEQVKDYLIDMDIEAVSITPAVDAVHIFTHVEWHMCSYRVNCAGLHDALTWVTPEELTERYAVPTAFRAFVRYLTAKQEKNP